jgi:Cu+-exporting ATPase
MVATGRGAELGVLYKGGEILERAAAIDLVVLDKTGTLTIGAPKVTDVVALDISREELLRVAASVEQASEHPVASAVVEAANGAVLAPVREFVALPGRGVEGVVEGRRVLVGTPELARERAIDLSRLALEGKAAFVVAIDGRAAGAITVADAIKPEAREAIAQLRALGVAIAIVSGDRRPAVEAVARELGLQGATARVLAEVLPEQKAEEIARLSAEGHVVAMVGDGINDAPALAKADVGVAVGTGTDIAIATADVTLLRGDLRAVARAIALSRATLRTIRQNLFWAFVYNAVGIPIAAGALYPLTGWTLSPVLASAAMSLSSVSVVTNSLRLRRAG